MIASAFFPPSSPRTKRGPRTAQRRCDCRSSCCGFQSQSIVDRIGHVMSDLCTLHVEDASHSGRGMTIANWPQKVSPDVRTLFCHQEEHVPRCIIITICATCWSGRSRRSQLYASGSEWYLHLLVLLSPSSALSPASNYSIFSSLPSFPLVFCTHLSLLGS